MKVIDNIEKLKEEINNLTGSIGLVPTMGALHEGHKSLIEKAVSQNDNAIVSVFVNPIQFCKGEDLDKYPKTLQKDIELCENSGVKILFCPTPDEMYKGDKNHLTLICPSYFDVDKLCGKSRPRHFDGVCSVVAKLFNLTKANKAYFGQKDAQQLYIVRKMVNDLNFDIEIIPCPIIREKDGLALSSRNKYLDDEERKEALNISKALFKAKQDFQNNIATKRSIIDNSLKLMENMNVEYIEFVNDDTFEMTDELNGKTRILIAARTKNSSTRLIDNILLG